LKTKAERRSQTRIPFAATLYWHRVAIGFHTQASIAAHLPLAGVASNAQVALC